MPTAEKKLISQPGAVPGKLPGTKPWNRVNLPVYSISSKKGDACNMNIITYASAISMKPKRFVCGIYHDTKTLENTASTGEFVLQLLSSSQYRLVTLLGKQSGNNIDKTALLHKRDELQWWKGYPVLKNCLAVMLLKTLQEFDAGDHQCFICDVTAYKNCNPGQPLTLDILRQHKLVRI
ncbi:MAG TPA: flavin reductase family protein [Ferruginibacter sp.]|nr:flavin reductase family protein [Ferruginibacter sp.]HMP20235.1 flavin reductase family protein [Ferruginibacter sp.]